MSAFSSPFQIFLDLQEGIILSVGLKHGETQDGSPMSNRILILYFLQTTQVMRIGMSMRLKNKIVDLASKFSTDKISQYFPLRFEIRFYWDSIKNFLIEPIDLTNFKSQSISNFFLLPFDKFINNLSHIFIISLHLQDLQQVQVLGRVSN